MNNVTLHHKTGYKFSSKRTLSDLYHCAGMSELIQ